MPRQPGKPVREVPKSGKRKAATATASETTATMFDERPLASAGAMKVFYGMTLHSITLGYASKTVIKLWKGELSQQKVLQ